MIELNGMCLSITLCVLINGCPGIQLIICLSAAGCLRSFSSILSLISVENLFIGFPLDFTMKIPLLLRYLFELILTVTISSSLFTSGYAIRYLIYNVQSVYDS